VRRAGRHRGQAAKLVDKVLKLRIFSDEAGKMNRSVQDVAAAC
jgi:D-Tyr-tRNAtyr deacylase